MAAKQKEQSPPKTTQGKPKQKGESKAKSKEKATSTRPSEKAKLEVVRGTELPGGQVSIDMIPVRKLKPAEDQPKGRCSGESFDDLVASVRAKGILQPILYFRDDEGNCHIIAGHRRHAAAKKAGLKEIPAIGKTAEEARLLRLVENIHRENLHPLDEAQELKGLQASNKGLTQEKLAALIGKSQTTVSQILSFNDRLSEDVRKAARKIPDVSRRILLKVVEAPKEEQLPLLRRLTRQVSEEKKAPRGKERIPGAMFRMTVLSLGKQYEKLSVEKLDAKTRDELIAGLEALAPKLQEIMEKLKGHTPSKSKNA